MIWQIMTIIRKVDQIHPDPAVIKQAAAIGTPALSINARARGFAGTLHPTVGRDALANLDILSVD